MLISTAGVASTPTRDVVAAAFKPTMEGLRARGFAKSELTKLRLKRLSATSMMAAGVAVRSKTDGQELERAGVIYLLQKTYSGWQFATVVLHDADDALRPTVAKRRRVQGREADGRTMGHSSAACYSFFC